ncbi:MAG TPA: endonuclease/exonuclease/phosphatase family protein [Chthonomonadales bacterium]|nr:endonuclease/exonuclease/phosphatase family protein [Chthonomonadales bacterium]
MRIVTSNIRGGLGMDGRRSIRRIAREVDLLQPDILCLQEVHCRLPWSRFANHPAILERLLRRKCLFAPAFRFGVGSFGVAILTRYPVSTARIWQLPSKSERRVALEAGIYAGGTEISVFCTHFGLDPMERQRQSAWLAGVVCAATGPVLVAGDLNECPSEPAVQSLLDLGGIKDAGCNRPTYPAREPRSAIDYILYGGGIAVSACMPKWSEASDHLPVCAEFAVQDRIDAPWSGRAGLGKGPA